MSTIEEECDESLLWMEVPVEAGKIPGERVAALMRKGSEIVAIIVASIRSARRRD
ncbi:MAG TPA: hypothetical protein VLT83_16390 [Opitutaceae bacterium]|nr:hypothetical protein [Opitutaceae bacterium]